MLVGLHVATNFEMYRQNSEKALLGGGELPPCPPPPPPATLMAGNDKEADIWFGRESAREARGKFKDFVCLVVFLCWIKRFVLLSLCLKCKYMNKYFSSFPKIEGGRSPQKNSRGSPPMLAAVVVPCARHSIFIAKSLGKDLSRQSSHAAFSQALLSQWSALKFSSNSIISVTVTWLTLA